MTSREQTPVQITTGIIIVVQEGRFRLACDDGGSALFMLAPEAAIDPQDLPDLAARMARVTVHYTNPEGIVARLAHRLREADQPHARQHSATGAQR